VLIYESFVRICAEFSVRELSISGGDDVLATYWRRQALAVTMARASVDSTAFAGTPAVVSWGYGRIDIFGRDTNDRLDGWHGRPGRHSRRTW
jgi:hypothetical protein